jgi:undecaprenyl-diphosphatase
MAAVPPVRSQSPTPSSAEAADSGLVTRLGIALVAACAFAVPVGLLAVLVGQKASPVVEMDTSIEEALHRFALVNPWFVEAMKLVSAVGQPTTFRVAGTVAALVVLASNRPRLALWAMVTIWGGALLGVVLKLVVARARPVFPDPVDTAGGFSFPSGHALGAFVGCGVVLILILPHLAGAARVVAWAVAVLVVATVAFSRVALGVHYTSDVLGGCLVGFAWMTVTMLAFEGWRTRMGLRRTHPAVEGLEPEAVEPDGEGGAVPSRWAAAAEVGHHLRTLWLPWVVVAAGVLGLGMLVAHVLDSGPVGRFDDALARRLQDARTPSGNLVSAVASGIGETPTIIAVAVIAYVSARIVFRRWHEPTVVLLAVVGEVVAFVVITAAVNRDRPPVTHLDEAPPTSSFPSGHTAATICCYGAIAALVAWRYRRTWVTVLAIVLAVALPVVVASARLYRGMHHLTDVLGGAVLGGAWLAVVVVLVLVRPCRPEPTKPPEAVEKVLDKLPTTH